ncbi:MAG: ATP synthase subunit I [Deltaproteobacteria bacterium]|nr:ATP synthase subunit I [Deltaproteobacteria bacterium]MBW2053012.1 ATP synthase subunit I [Deltaproteobacteria bacterium]MBW2141788.1 ATP synthase subunit I [Deltaproteobacteria bacterium]MBW2324513.1 ATP synthase subunit I [Deltaproteobacteria bacterium]
METLIQFKKTILVQMLFLAALVAMVALGLGFANAARGFVLGSIFSLANFLVMSYLLTWRLGKSSRRAGAESALSMLARLVILGAPLFIAIRNPARFNLIWTIIGIFNLQISVLVYQLVIERYGLIRSTDPERR